MGWFAGTLLGILGLHTESTTGFSMGIFLGAIFIILFLPVFIGTRIASVSEIKQSIGMGAGIGVTIGIYIGTTFITLSQSQLSAEKNVLAFLLSLLFFTIFGLFTGTIVGLISKLLPNPRINLSDVQVLLNKNKMKQWWKKQSIAIKAAILAGLFSLLAASCTLLGGIVTQYIDSYIANRSNKFATYPIYLNSAWDRSQAEYEPFSKEIDDTLYGLVPTKCALIDLGDFYGELPSDQASPLENTQKRSFAFDIVTEETMIISSGKVRVKSYTPPLSEKKISGEIGFFYTPGGMGEVPIIHFQEKTIDKSTKEVVTNRSGGSL